MEEKEMVPVISDVTAKVRYSKPIDESLITFPQGQCIVEAKIGLQESRNGGNSGPVCPHS
jgi:hypothetical protein